MTSVTALLVGVALGSGAPAMPEASTRLSPELRAKPTVVVSATLRQIRVSWHTVPGRLESWASIPCFTIEKVYRGTVRAHCIPLDDGTAIGSGGATVSRSVGGRYLLFLRPSPKSLRQIGNRSWTPRPGESLPRDEVVAVVQE
jgi:hypothetical protein